MKTRYYIILVQLDGKWVEFDDREYTEKEANAFLRECKKDNCQHKYRKKFYEECETITLSVHTH